MGQNFSSLEYAKCREPCTTTDAVFSKSQIKVTFEKNSALPIEKCPFLVLARDTIMLQQLIIHFPLHYLSSGRLREVKNKRKFPTFSSKKGPGRLPEGSRLTEVNFKYSDLTWKCWKSSP